MMSSQKPTPVGVWKVATAGFATSLVTTAFEVIKSTTFPGISLWQSHIVTVLFCTTLVVIISALIFRREQNALSASRSFSDSLMESLPGVVCIFDASGKIRRWNNNFLGYLPSQMVGSSIIDTAAPASLDALHQAMKSTFDNGVGETEALLVSATGARIPCLLKGMRIIFENEPCVIGIAMDISKRKRAEESLRLHTKALESAANAIVITDAHGAIQWVNPAFKQLTGYAFDEVLGQNPRILKSGTEGRLFYASLWSTILAGNIWQGEIVNRKKDGQLYIEEMTISPVRSAAGELTNFVAVKQDITARKRAEEELRFKTALLEAQVENTIDGILAVDASEKIILSNNKLAMLWNIPADLIATRDDTRLLQHALNQLENPEQFLAQVKYLYEHKEEKSRDEIHLRDGRFFDRFSAPLTGSDGKYYGRI